MPPVLTSIGAFKQSLTGSAFEALAACTADSLTIISFPDNASAWVEEIIRDFADPEMPLEVRRLGRTIKRRRNQIVAWHRSHVSNGPTEAVMPLEDLKAKWEAFGWHVLEINGNDIEAVIDACAMGRATVEKPTMIIAHTIPGKGVDFMESDFRWHGKPPSLSTLPLSWST